MSPEQVYQDCLGTITPAGCRRFKETLSTCHVGNIFLAGSLRYSTVLTLDVSQSFMLLNLELAIHMLRMCERAGECFTSGVEAIEQNVVGSRIRMIDLKTHHADAMYLVVRLSIHSVWVKQTVRSSIRPTGADGLQPRRH